RLIAMKRDFYAEDRVSVLDCSDAPGGEALAVTNAIDLVDDGDRRVAAEQEIGVQGMGRPAGHIDRAAGRDQRLPDHLSTEHPLPAHLGRAAAKQIELNRLEVERAQELLDGGWHEGGGAA